MSPSSAGNVLVCKGATHTGEKSKTLAQQTTQLTDFNWFLGEFFHFLAFYRFSFAEITANAANAVNAAGRRKMRLMKF